jgi:serine O-acetyltransferase
MKKATLRPTRVIDKTVSDLMSGYCPGIRGHDPMSQLGAKQHSSWTEMCMFAASCWDVMHPGFGNNRNTNNRMLESVTKIRVQNLGDSVRKMSMLPGNLTGDAKIEHAHSKKQPNDIFIRTLAPTRYKLSMDLQAAFKGDPAAHSMEEVIICYPGYYAIFVHRISHELYKAGLVIPARMLSESAHSRTGIDIHPAASIGDRFFIDHGTGVVIGQTTEIGNDVKLYHGVNLGALSFEKEDGELVRGDYKRHPTIGDRVTIYSNTTILGGQTKIGDDTIIGAGVWLTESVPNNVKVIRRKPVVTPRAKNPEDNIWIYQL